MTERKKRQERWHYGVGNVIFADFGKTQKQSHVHEEVRDSQPLARLIEQWLAEHTDPGRKERGRDYYRKGAVHHVHCDGHGHIEAYVQGSQSEPFAVELFLPERTTTDITCLVNALKENQYAARELYKEQFNNQLFCDFLLKPEEHIGVRCTCPDTHAVCKHAVALGMSITHRITECPRFSLEIRGVNSADIKRRLHEALEAKKIARENHGKDERFWSAGTLPELPQPTEISITEDSDSQALHRLFRSASLTSLDEMRGVADMEDVYEFLRHRTEEN